ncbi:MAG: O-antigen ligase family protein [Candidatus Doudnabacteria bacterium]|nr:O-antigen ligase family protein [Candidatus Doudnabacteria bacterium]
MQNRSAFFSISKYVLLTATILSFLTPLWVFKDLLFPFITSKAFYLRILVEIGFPFFVYMLVADKESRPSYKNPLHIAVVAFWIVNVFSGIFGLDPIKALWGNFERMGGVFYLTHLVLLYFYIVVLAKQEFSFLKSIVYSNIVIASALCFYAVLVRMGMKPWVPDPSLPRVSATFGNPIFFPSYLIPILFLTLFWAFRKKDWGRYVLLACAALQVIAIFLSGTRGAVVGLLAGGFISAVVGIALSKNKKVKMWGLGATAALVLVGGLLYFNSGKLPEGSMLRRIFQLKDSNTQARLIQWGVALKGFKDYPVLGVGAENYYITGNKYYNPEIYKYDPSWFDKPHNFILEVLVTNGILGLAAYLSIIIFSLVAFYKAWRFGAVSVLEGVLLLCGLLVYQVQNLFVFDTVSASMTFFIYTAFTAFLWEKILQPEDQKNKKVKGQAQASQGLAYSVFSVGLLVAIYAIWVGNALPLKASKNTNYGYAYAQAGRYKEAVAYFKDAVSQGFNFDQSETSHKYQEFVLGLLRNPQDSNREFVDTAVKGAIDAMENVLATNPHNPITWQKLGTLYLSYSFATQTAPDPKVKESLEKAVSLAPGRTEARSVLMQLYLLQGNMQKALEIGREVVAVNPASLDSKWQLSIALKESGNEAEAIKLSDELLDKAYPFNSTGSLVWLLEYYKKNNNYSRIIQVYERAINLDPKNKTWYVGLVDAYSQAGKTQEAKSLAEKLIQADSSLKPDLEIYTK